MRVRDICEDTLRAGRAVCLSSGLMVRVLIVIGVLVAVPSGRSATAQAGGGIASVLPAMPFDHPTWSPHGGNYLALSGDNDRGVYVHNPRDGTCLRLTDSPSSGYAFNWSPDGQRLGFKRLIPVAGVPLPLQQPMVYHVAKRRLVPLCEPVARAGVPSFSSDGRTTYTVDRELRVLDAAGQTTRFALDHYANLTPISPDGTYVAFNNRYDAICVLELATDKLTTLTPAGEGHFGPVWSPDSTSLAVSTTGGLLRTINVATRQLHNLDTGSLPSWSPDSQYVFYAAAERIETVRVIRSDLYCIGSDGQGKTRLTQDVGEFAASGSVSSDGGKVAYVSHRDGKVYQAPLRSELRATTSTQGQSWSLGTKSRIIGEGATVQDLGTGDIAGAAAIQAVPKATAGQVVLSRPVPYVHQVYDTPNDFNGHWACGATSAIMGIQYFNILPNWDVNCSQPSPHVSHFGRYVSQTYTYNGFTYNIGSEDPNGHLAYGGYGYIVREDWKDTKGYMRDYIINHGIPSAVDWSPTFNKLKAEIDADQPFVVLNNLTSLGHYILAIGYYTDQYTAIFNDPYGNKNNPGYPNVDGAGAYYDFPGYNNGFQNLSKVWCYIYCRGPSIPAITQHPVGQTVRANATTTFTVEAGGFGTLSYQWLQNGANLSDIGRYAGSTTSTLTIDSTRTGDEADYRCVVTNVYGSTTSNAAHLTVLSPDFDRDGDVDQEDFGKLQACLGISNVSQTAPSCIITDLDNNNWVEAADLTIFQSCLRGPNTPPPSGCAN